MLLTATSYTVRIRHVSLHPGAPRGGGDRCQVSHSLSATKSYFDATAEQATEEVSLSCLDAVRSHVDDRVRYAPDPRGYAAYHFAWVSTLRGQFGTRRWARPLSNHTVVDIQQCSCNVRSGKEGLRRSVPLPSPGLRTRHRDGRQLACTCRGNKLTNAAGVLKMKNAH